MGTEYQSRRSASLDCRALLAMTEGAFVIARSVSDEAIFNLIVKVTRSDSERQIPQFPHGDSVRLAPGCKPFASLCATIGARLERKGGGRGLRLCANDRLETAPLSKPINVWSFRAAKTPELSGFADPALPDSQTAPLFKLNDKCVELLL